jgi:TonB family protein
MKHLLLCLSVAILAVASSPGAEQTTFKEISKDSLKKLGLVFEIADGEVNVDSDTIKRIEIGVGNVLVTFRNKTNEKRDAACTLLLFNKAGMQLANVTVGAMFSATLAPGAVDRRDATFSIPDAETLLAETGLALPPDWRTPKFVVVGKTASERMREGRADVQPVPKSQTRPVYPAAMRRAGIAGEVTVEFKIDAHGNVVDAHAVRSSQIDFESAAIDCVKKWKFRPALKDGKPFEVRMQMPIVFSLGDN